MNLVFLRDRIGWFGNHSGYEQLSSSVEKVGKTPVKCISPAGGLLRRLAGKLTSLTLGHGYTNQAQACARLEAFLRLSASPDAILHLLYGEGHAAYWRSFPSRAHARSILTIHQPPSQWTAKSLDNLRWVRHAILLYQRDLEFFQAAMPDARVHYIPHGVNVDFFHPVTERQSGPKRLLYNGVHLRNFAMLRRVVPAIASRHPEVCFDFLVPKHRRDVSLFGDLLSHRAITWHAGLDDNQLRTLYQQAHALLLPMDESGANTAVVEALSCGLPIVTTDVGGIRDYGGGTVFPVVGNNADEAMLELVERYLDNAAWRDEVVLASRRFAEQTLAWPLVARRHMEIYSELLH